MTELEELVEEFALNVDAQTKAMWRGDAKTGNKHADRFLAAFNALCAHGDVGRDSLATLLKHPNMDVRTTAAAFLLRYRTSEAKAVLEEAAKREGFVAFASAQTLKNWEEGTWALDPADPADPPVKRARARTKGKETQGRRRGHHRGKSGE
jgi:hypothetical protein